ncbi:MAG: phosphoglucosamine mutase [Clostridia bacterium]|nr:phosphoglucosamine mutase [Clostridia bacterium]
MGQALPQIDKALELCNVFGVSADVLLRDEIEIEKRQKSAGAGQTANKYFGTDGFRGEVGVDLTAYQAFRIGRFLGWYYASRLSGCQKHNYRPRVVIGKDTRRSSYTLEYSIAAGLAASGADAHMLHVTTTPSVSYVTRLDGFDCGIMITASHNPFYDNGIKILNRYGEKLDDGTTALIEAYIDGEYDRLGLEGDIPYAEKEGLGRIVDYVAGRNRYVGYLISIASFSYRDIKIGLDTANGAAWTIAKAVFEALGAKTYITGAEPDGLNINNGYGSTHIERLIELVRENRLDVGFAFDGDADRCIAVTHDGRVVDGDGILYVLGRRLKERGSLDKNTIVTTVMSNTGLYRALREAGIEYRTTRVGDRFVYECMQEGGYKIGGEQSGHIILKKYATTGDGILTAIMLCEEMCDRKATLAELTRPLVLLPQKMKNIRVSDKARVARDPDILAAVREIAEEIGEDGRILLRESGTEPLIRIMVEAKSEELCDGYIERARSAIEKKGYIQK